MIVQNREGDWVLRIYSKNPDGSWFVGTEQYFPTRALMRKHVKTWKMVYMNSNVQFKIKTYRIYMTVTSVSETTGFYNTVMYVETR